MSKKLIIANQKMYMNHETILDFITALHDYAKLDNVIICPSFLYINDYSEFNCGAQNVSIHDNGAYTGEVSAQQLKSMGVKYCIVGHSERRQYQKETDSEINQKIIKLLENDITPILCIGETLSDKQQDLSVQIVEKELTEDLKNLSPTMVEKIIIAYEPIWAISSNQGLPISNDDIIAMVNEIKRIISASYHTTNVKVLYGGSVSDKNIANLEEITSIDGYLIGGASTKKEVFKTIIEC